MALMTVSQLQKYTDKLAVAFEQMKTFGYSPGIGGTVTAQSSPVAGTYFNLLTNLEALIANAGDQEIEADLGPNVRTMRLRAWIRWVLNDLKTSVSQLNDHMAARGSQVNASILDLSSFLTYYNGGSGANKFGCLLHPSFVELFNFVMTPTTMNILGAMSPGIHPNLPTPGAGSANGMGTKTVAGSVFTAGAAVNTTYYQAVNLVAETTQTFVGGVAAPTVTVTGTDDLGNAAQTWTGTLTGNNPATALATTITGALAAHTYGSNLVGSSAGFCVGQVAVIDNGLPTQESVIIEAIADATHMTFATRIAHGAAAPIIAGGSSVALTPGSSGRRCVSVSAIAIGISSHTLGTVRICGVQDRMGNPVN